MGTKNVKVDTKTVEMGTENVKTSRLNVKLPTEKFNGGIYEKSVEKN